MREEKYFQIKDQLKYPKKEIVQRFFSHFFFRRSDPSRGMTDSDDNYKGHGEKKRSRKHNILYSE